MRLGSLNVLTPTPWRRSSASALWPCLRNTCATTDKVPIGSELVWRSALGMAPNRKPGQIGFTVPGMALA